MTKQVIVAYSMYGFQSTATGSIRLTMLSETADAVLAGTPNESVDAILDNMARLRGYDRAVFTGAREADRP